MLTDEEFHVFSLGTWKHDTCVDEWPQWPQWPHWTVLQVSNGWRYDTLHHKSRTVATLDEAKRLVEEEYRKWENR